MVQPGVRIELLCCFIISLLAGCTSCNHQQNNDQSQTTIPSKPSIPAPSFNPDSAYLYVKIQVDFGPRVPNSVAHTKCGDYLAVQLRQWCDTVIEQRTSIKAHDGKMLDNRNLIGSFNPQLNNRILLCSHWDTRPWADQDTVDKDKPFDSANDGPSGVGVLLEVARQLYIAHPHIGVDIIFFDMEDYGKTSDENTYALGTQYWAKNPHVPGYAAQYGILLDMVGAEKATFTKEGSSMQYAGDVVDKVWRIAAAKGFSDYFIFQETKGIIDDHTYVNTMANIKCIDIIHYDYNTPSNFWKYWHTHGDTMDKINRNTLKAVGQTLLEVLYAELSSLQFIVYGC